MATYAKFNNNVRTGFGSVEAEFDNANAMAAMIYLNGAREKYIGHIQYGGIGKINTVELSPPHDIKGICALVRGKLDSTLNYDPFLDGVGSDPIAVWHNLDVLWSVYIFGQGSKEASFPEGSLELAFNEDYTLIMPLYYDAQTITIASKGKVMLSCHGFHNTTSRTKATPLGIGR